MAKITYLLGAGASANTLPVVANMHERMIKVCAKLRSMIPDVLDPSYKHDDHSRGIVQNKHILESILRDIEWLISEAGNYYTIDSLAKKYYLTDEIENLKRLKKSLILYFTIEQFLLVETERRQKRSTNFGKKDIIDKRYSSFIAAVSEKRYYASTGMGSERITEAFGFELNQNIKLISWNYDVQFELSLKAFTTGAILQAIKSAFNILPNNESKNDVNDTKIELNKFGMVKLNGDAVWNKVFNNGAFKDDVKYSVFDGKSNVSEYEMLVDFLEGYKTGNLAQEAPNNSNISPLMGFNFAWENDPNFHDKYRGHSKNLEAAEKIAEQTEILVVIGYSFPIFNRDIDNRLFKKMAKNLTKVYIQDKNPDRIESTIRNAFSVMQELKVVPKNPDPFEDISYNVNQEYMNIYKVEVLKEEYTDQFVIPYELNQE